MAHPGRRQEGARSEFPVAGTVSTGVLGTFVGSLWAVLGAAALAVYLAWGVIGRRDPDAALGIVLGIAVLVLPAVSLLALRRGAPPQLRRVPLPAGLVGDSLHEVLGRQTRR